MPKYKNYYIVEYRLPILVEDINSVQEAVSRARRICSNRFGFSPENWYARVVEYSSESDMGGPVKEYFYNPHSSNYREIEANIGYHNDMIARGLDPLDPIEFSEEEIQDEA